LSAERFQKSSCTWSDGILEHGHFKRENSAFNKSSISTLSDGILEQGTITARLPSIVSSMTKDLRASADALFSGDSGSQKQVESADAW
jgi:hypothetical protein